MNVINEAKKITLDGAIIMATALKYGVNFSADSAEFLCGTANTLANSFAPAPKIGLGDILSKKTNAYAKKLPEKLIGYLKSQRSSVA